MIIDVGGVSHLVWVIVAMAFGYHFIDLDDAQKHERRALLDRYALYAQISTLLPFAIVQCAFYASRLKLRWISQDDIQTPGSPSLKEGQHRRSTSWKATVRRIKWWLGDEVVVARESWGTKGQVLLAAVYMVLLLSLCFVQTGPGE